MPSVATSQESDQPRAPGTQAAMAAAATGGGSTPNQVPDKATCQADHRVPAAEFPEDTCG